MDFMNNMPNSKMLMYQTEDGQTKIDIYFENDTVWMNQDMLVNLYQTTKQNISKHIKEIYKEEELKEDETCTYYEQTKQEGNRSVKRNVKYYNLQMILAIGYRVKTHRGIQFRNWVTNVLEEYMKKGFVMNDERLKNPKEFGADYFDELLERIRDIRTSEKRFYKKITDIYALSVDYDPHTEDSKRFFATVQNKLHFAIHGLTAAELIDNRADAEKPNMGLTNFKGTRVRKCDITVAKNYLTEEELKSLNRIVTMYLDYAEDQAHMNVPMYMKDWSDRLDDFLKFNRRDILEGQGKISKILAEKKAKEQYELYNNGLIKENDRKSIDEFDEIELTKR